MMEGPVSIMVAAYFTRPKSAPKSRTHHTVKPDASNILKLVEDGLTGILYRDDAQIVSAIVTKFYGSPERVELEIGEI